MAFKENSVEIPPMNRNINILGMHYVNPHFSGVLDKINESKEQALKVTGEVFFVCCAPQSLGAGLAAQGDGVPLVHMEETSWVLHGMGRSRPG